MGASLDGRLCLCQVIGHRRVLSFICRFFAWIARMTTDECWSWDRMSRLSDGRQSMVQKSTSKKKVRIANTL